MNEQMTGANGFFVPGNPYWDLGLTKHIPPREIFTDMAEEHAQEARAHDAEIAAAQTETDRRRQVGIEAIANILNGDNK